MTIIEQAWTQLDTEVDEIMALTTKVGRGEHDFEYDLAFAKAAARGKAEILALLTTPFFTTADEISAEAGRRYQARQAGVDPQTPGISVSWQPNMGAAS
jgi:hypothetical protein